MLERITLVPTPRTIRLTHNTPLFRLLHFFLTRFFVPPSSTSFFLHHTKTGIINRNFASFVFLSTDTNKIPYKETRRGGSKDRWNGGVGTIHAHDPRRRRGFDFPSTSSAGQKKQKLRFRLVLIFLLFFFCSKLTSPITEVEGGGGGGPWVR